MAYTSDDPEQEFEIDLHLVVKGFGKVHHQLQLAAEVKRLLEVGLSREVDIYREVGDDEMVKVTRRDRNAQQAAGTITDG